MPTKQKEHNKKHSLFAVHSDRNEMRERFLFKKHGKVKFGSLMGALKTGAHQLKVVNFDPNYLNNVCFF